MRVVSFLAEFGTVDQNRLTIVHGAVDLLYPLTPFCVAIIAYVPIDEAGKMHTVRYELLDAIGLPVTVADGALPLKFDRKLSVSRPAGLPEDTVFQNPQVLPLAGLPLRPGRYCWHITVDGAGHPDWDAHFVVRPPVAQSS
jgi:hypothetical protein